MKVFAKRIIVLLIAALIVLCSTLLSVNLSLSKQFDKVTDGFYNGALHNGNKEPSLHSQLLIVGKEASALAAVAERNGLNVSEFRDNADYFCRDVITMQDDISYIYYCYQDLLDELMEVGQALTSLTLSANDEAAAVKSLQSIMDAQGLINASGYNESVRQYISSLPFLTVFFADLAGVDLPEYFA